MQTSLLTLLILSTWTASCQSQKCGWFGVYCGRKRACEGYDLVYMDRHHGECDDDGVSFCCPKGEGTPVVFCTGPNRGGDCRVTFIPPGEDCAELPRDNNTNHIHEARSMMTRGACVRLWRALGCKGKTKLYNVGDENFVNTDDMPKALSVSPCFKNDKVIQMCKKQRYAGISKRAIDLNCNNIILGTANRPIEGPARFARDELFIGANESLIQQNVPDRNSPIRWIQFGPGGRTQALEALIEERHLGTGTAASNAARQFTAQHGYQGNPRDDAGHILDRNFGGPGDQLWNIFPQMRHFNRGVWGQIGRAIAHYIRNYGSVVWNINLQYADDDPNTQRPWRIIYRVMSLNGTHVLDVDDLLNPEGGYTGQ
nr:PREDICTED: uncharacterized protein LOC109039148 [Bemisia tabaci]